MCSLNNQIYNVIVDVYSAHTECTIQRRVNTKEGIKNDFDKKITTAKFLRYKLIWKWSIIWSSLSLTPKLLISSMVRSLQLLYMVVRTIRIYYSIFLFGNHVIMSVCHCTFLYQKILTIFIYLLMILPCSLNICREEFCSLIWWYEFAFLEWQ